MSQPRLPHTLPTPAAARAAHKKAVAAERLALETCENMRAAYREAKAALKKCQEMRRTAEDDLDAVEEGRRPER